MHVHKYITKQDSSFSSSEFEYNLEQLQKNFNVLVFALIGTYISHCVVICVGLF